MTGLLMVVDDDAVARQTMEDILTDEGYEVIVAYDGRDASEQLTRRVPQLLLTDLEMPELNGERLIAHVRASHPRLPILVLTSRHVIDARREAERLGVSGYINKPIEIDTLLSAIAALTTGTGAAATS
jgi:CheY-like chemotaxis protein